MSETNASPRYAAQAGSSAAPPMPLDGTCENRGCTNKAVRLAYDDEHDTRPWWACERCYGWIHR